MLMTTKLYCSKTWQAVLMEDNRVPLRLGNITEQLERNLTVRHYKAFTISLKEFFPHCTCKTDLNTETLTPPSGKYVFFVWHKWKLSGTWIAWGYSKHTFQSSILSSNYIVPILSLFLLSSISSCLRDLYNSQILMSAQQWEYSSLVYCSCKAATTHIALSNTNNKHVF